MTPERGSGPSGSDEDLENEEPGSESALTHPRSRRVPHHSKYNKRTENYHRRSMMLSSATERVLSDTGPSTLISNLCIQTCERIVHKSHPDADGYTTTTC